MIAGGGGGYFMEPYLIQWPQLLFRLSMLVLQILSLRVA